MVFSVSPSVTTREVDLTTVIPSPQPGSAAIAGLFHWGPANERVFITSENALVNTFGKPSDFNGETFFTSADFLSYSNSLYVVRVIDDSAAIASSTYFEGKYHGELGNSILVSYISTGISDDPNAETVLFDPLEISGGTTDFNTNVFVIETTEDLGINAIIVGDILTVGSTSVGFQDLVVSNIAITADSANTVAYTCVITFENNYTLPEESISNLTFVKKWGYSNNVASKPSAGSIHIAVIDNDGTVSGIKGQILELYENLSLSTTGKLPDGSNNYYKEVIGVKSKWINALTASSISDASTSTSYNLFTGGIDGALGLTETTVSPLVIAKGYDLFKEANEVDVSFILQGKAPGSTRSVASNLANYIISNITESRRDCVAFISPRKEDVVEIFSTDQTVKNVLEYRALIQKSSYSFIDSGYKYRYDKYNDTYRWVPLNGDMAGLAAKVESWESPAGYRKGLIRNVIKLAFNPNKAQRDVLYGSEINPVITQTGQGTLLFGDKTGLSSSSGSAFGRLNVRRLFITVEKAIATISAQFLFEFNDEFTQTQFRNIVNPFLRDIQGRRGIIDFRVVSDSTINTPDVVDNNIFKSNIFIKPAKSINFIELNFIATRSGIEFEEIAGQQF
jgi:hypothetical protein